MKASANKGRVDLVGAGPGDPDLITLKAARLIQSADTVVYDHLVGEGVLDLIPPKAERVYAGKEAGRHPLPQEEICALLIEKAREGKRIVRLKGGDPFVFGRGGEEVDTLARAGIEVGVVPGITAALGAAASFGFPLTHRGYAQSCLFATGHLKNHTVDLDWPMLARPGQTVVIYMGVIGIEIISARLQEAGLPGDTPAALIYRATCPNQKIFPASVATLPRIARDEQLKPPALIVIGQVVKQATMQIPAADASSPETAASPGLQGAPEDRG
ncbi:MAG: uroporphyrinogen-III C-methyltransferase [Candidatus Accumulibacter sp.]|jgi:uroporphyrin-III C-methyltransferase|nr:uroporphyrinogen-III C-methyltransferase [Accumulibacter sp.]